MTTDTKALQHGGECLTDESAREVCEALYAEKVDEIFDIVEALKAVATLCGGDDQESMKLRVLALTAIATQKTDRAEADCARRELMQYQLVTTRVER